MNEMPLHIADVIRYDQPRGLVLLREPSGAFAEYADVESIARALESTPTLPYFAAGYGLALAARAWADWPTDSRRSAVIQAGARLQQVRPDGAAQRFIVAGVERADLAALNGESVEAALVAFVAEAVKRADRSAERCGRRAAELLDEGDGVLIVGTFAHSLWWMLHTAQIEQQRQVQLYVTSAAQQNVLSTIASPVTVLTDAAISAGFAAQRFSVCIVVAGRVALDGSVAVSDAGQRIVAFAQQHHVPRYVLCDDGPDPEAATGATLLPNHVLSFDQISAIVTDRGIYRAEMIARYLGDGDAPQDVIPLTG